MKWAGLVGLGLLSAMAFGDDPKPLSPTIDMGVPYSAAQKMLGLDPSKVSSPSSLASRAISILRSFGAGNIGEGLSYSLSLQELNGSDLTAAQWEENSFGTRLANFTQLSFALVAGNGTDAPGRAAVGIAFPYKDETDWRTNKDARQQYVIAFDKFFTAFKTDLPKYVNWPSDFTLAEGQKKVAEGAAKVKAFSEDFVDKLPANLSAEKKAGLVTAVNGYADAASAYSTEVGKLTTAFESPANIVTQKDAFAAYSKAIKVYGLVNDALVEARIDKDMIKKLSEAFEEQAGAYFWFRDKVDVAVGSSWGALDNTYEHLMPTGTRVWISWTMALETPDFKFAYDPKSEFVKPTFANLTVYAAAASNERAFANQAFSAPTNGYEVGLRYKRGSSVSSMFFEGLYKGGSTNKVTSWGLGLEKRLQDKQWLQVSLGSDKEKSQGILLGVGYSFNISSAPSLALK